MLTGTSLWARSRVLEAVPGGGVCERVCVGVVDVPARKTEEQSFRGDLVEVTLDLGEGSPVLMSMPSSSLTRAARRAVETA